MHSRFVLLFFFALFLFFFFLFWVVFGRSWSLWFLTDMTGSDRELSVHGKYASPITFLWRALDKTLL